MLRLLCALVFVSTLAASAADSPGSPPIPSRSIVLEHVTILRIIDDSDPVTWIYSGVKLSTMEKIEFEEEPGLVVGQTYLLDL